METKRCYTCKKEKSLNEFHKDKYGVKGCAPSCKICKRAYQKEHYERNKAAYHASAKIARKKWSEGNGKERVLQHARATRARRRVQSKGGDHILIDALYARDNGICRICGEDCTMRQASIDHIKPISLGGLHTWDNVQLAHLDCNRKKGAKYEDA